MALPNDVVLPDSVLRELAPGEVALFAANATQLAGYNGVGRAERPRANPTVDLNPLSLLAGTGGLEVDSGWMESKLGGVNAAGATGSLADQFSRALGANLCQIVLTDRRLALAAEVSKLLTLRTDVRIVWSVDRRAVAGVRRMRRFLQWGRVRIDFADRSWAMAMLGMLFGSAANRLVRAFDAPRG